MGSSMSKNPVDIHADECRDFILSTHISGNMRISISGW